MRKMLLTLCLMCALGTAAQAQDVDRDVFIETRELVGKIGPMRDSSLKGIVKAITSRCNVPACYLYGIYLWTAQNIKLDCTPRLGQNSSASYVLRTREASSEGFANLIAEMCKLVHIPCEVVTGLAKWDAGDINNVDVEANASAWNVVNLDKKWYVLDASMGAGYCDGKHFTKQLTDAWMLSNRRLFALSHFPNDKKKQLLDTPVERAEFVAAPAIGAITNIIGIVPPPGTKGLIRGRHKDTVQLSFSVYPAGNVERIGSAAIVTDGKPVPVPFMKQSGQLTVMIPLPEEGKYPLTLLINNAGAFSYQVQAGPALKRRR